ncbi:hypothetical protein C8R47DRAFT_1079315 [Mycena vitilis]|nr:hypothetical protein C8R47DRAFT_1079315 [Mycena vitilis]
MTAHNQSTPATDTSAPGVATPAQVAALQTMWAAMTTLTQGQAPASPPPVVAAPATMDEAALGDEAPPLSLAAAPTPALTPTVNATPSVPAPTAFRSRGPWVVGAVYHVVPAAPLVPILEDGDEDSWYAIYRGLYVGITLNNALASAAVVGVSGSSMKSHKTQDRALAAFNEMLRYNQFAYKSRFIEIPSLIWHIVSELQARNQMETNRDSVPTPPLLHSLISSISGALIPALIVLMETLRLSMTRLDVPDEGGGHDEQDVLSRFSRLNLDPPPTAQAPRGPRRFPSIVLGSSHRARIGATPSDPPARIPPPYAPVDHRASVIPPATRALPFASPLSTPRVREYHFETPTHIGSTTEWSVAGGLTQGVSNTTVHASSTPKKKNKRRRRSAQAYVVFVGRVPGVSPTWAEARQHVDGVSNAVYRSYRTVPAAESAFLYAVERSWTRVSDSSARVPIPSLPHPVDEAARDNPLHVSEDLDDRWFIVYRGIWPGVYHSLLESQLNVLGVRGAVHESVQGKELAFQKFTTARSKNMTAYLLPTYHPDVAALEMDPLAPL